MIAAVQKSYVFGCNTKLFYEILSSFRRNVVRIDLTHAFSSPEVGMEYFSLNYVDYLDKRIVINNRTLNDYQKLYKSNNINSHFLNRFEIIPNGVKINDFNNSLIKKRFDNFIVGFVGRNSPEKRPELFFKIVKEAGVQSKVIGDDFQIFKQENQNTIFFENCNEPEIVRNQFADISVLIVTSDKEGFPLVIMEAMELGIPIISSNVGSVSEHLQNNVNGFLIPIDFDVSSVVGIIREISNNFTLYNKLSVASRGHAVEHFDIFNFRKRYQKLFE
jgi:glycosyltransferase involved in cell wall biosynthesis